MIRKVFELIALAVAVAAIFVMTRDLVDALINGSGYLVLYVRLAALFALALFAWRIAEMLGERKATKERRSRDGV